MTFKQYIEHNEERTSPVPKYIWMEGEYVTVYKYVKAPDIYQIFKVKDDHNGWRNFHTDDSTFGLYSRREMTELFGNVEFTELMDDTELEEQMMLDNI